MKSARRSLLLSFLLGATALAFTPLLPADGHAPESNPGSVGTKMLRYPDIHGDQLVFSYAGDLWLANVDGSAPARRLTSHPGLELYPKFSPDGTQVAFAGQYRGDEQVYVIDVAGGEPAQLTYYPVSGPLPARWGTDHQVYGWTPDGQAVIFRSLREMFGNGKLYQVSVAGGLPKALPMPMAGSGDLSPDGAWVVYSPLFRDFRTWKRYQGGWAQNLYIYDLEADQAEQITDHIRTERDPMWLTSGIHFVSDRTGTLNLFRYADGEITQLTDSDRWDMKWASSDGVSQIVYEIEGTIGHFDTNTGVERRLAITVPDDHVRRTARRIEVNGQVSNFAAGPDGKRAAVVARGDVFTVPVEHGVTRNLTQRGDAHDREAAWSPDGRYVAFISDRNGEEQLFIVDQSGGEPRVLSEPRALRLYQPVWSPDSELIAYYDHTGVVHVTDLEGDHRVVVESPYGPSTDYAWAPDSQWLAFSRSQAGSDNEVLSVWSRDSGRVTNVTDGFFDAYSPSFSLDGKHLFYASTRQFAPQIGSSEWNYVTDRENGIFAIALAEDSGNPFLPRNDEVVIKAEEEEEEDKDKDDEEGAETVSVTIDFDGIEQRIIRVPVSDDNLFWVYAIEGKLLYVTGGPFYYGRSSDVETTLHAFDFKKRESDTLVEGLQGLSVSADGKTAFVQQNGSMKRFDLSNPDDPKNVSLDNLIVYRSAAEEWPVIFDEVWRRFRDYFYVDNLHGYDWEALREQYRPLVADVSTREDLNTLMGEMIAELNVGHAYVQGGDLQAPPRSGAALLGATFEADERAGRYRFAKIYEGHNEEGRYRSPLTEVGMDVSEGDYLLAIDGRALTLEDNPYDLLTDRGSQPVELLVGESADVDDARTVLVNGISDETNLVYLEWVLKNHRYVQEQTDGRVGYLHIPDMGSGGIYEFIKWFYPQIRKQGLVVDVRSNGGGNVSQMIIRRLMQKPLAFGFQAHSDWTETYPGTAFIGPMVALMSEDSASDGDIFPYMFREAGLGPLIGKKSWGGTVGITNRGPLLDGGSVFVPEFGLGQPGKGWIIEGEGVTPDIEVDNDPASDGDAQLDRGIAEVLQRIEAQQPSFMPKPASPDKTD
ncbi:MAG: LpqB family beta-propeller domain-containing protein [Pseudomonadota bacterium]